ncbi:FAD-binding oxidoreductase [Actinomadura sp. KC216]|uniref:FAD-binding oxidoreductase n=1 Tax=Actinomadura sp. KC216 TaxID=2530370 RepID=UPI00104738E1|nr:FAD-binding oxidoreductase [Actinomadura sp. KC216]TDB90688.1 FAD-binding oxidoreductase [Actinomadura sp. KC216]
MADGPSRHERVITELRDNLRGPLITAADAGYDEARGVWNGAIDRRPIAVARVAGTADVVTALGVAREHGLPVAVRGGGHNVAGFATCDDGIVVDLSALKGIRVDRAARTARAQGGVVWGELDAETQAFGLATTGGVVSGTGIAGFTLGGGIGWLMRKHGVAADNLVSADVVTAAGETVTADGRENRELLWGLRGGGGNFGVVTSLEYRLLPVGPLVYGGVILFPAERGPELLRFYAEWTRDLPDELTTMVVFLAAPPMPFVPAEWHGRQAIAVACCHIGTADAATAAFKELRDFGEPVADALGPIPYTVLQGMFDPTAPRGINAYWKTHHLADLAGPAIDTAAERAAELTRLFPLSAVHFHHLEGAVARGSSGDGAFSHRTPRFVMNILGMWADAADADPHTRWVRGTWDAMRAHATGDPYLNFLADEGGTQVRRAYSDEVFARLTALKKKYDPENLFRLNQNIPPG